MKHAGPSALDRLEPLLETLRREPRLKEKSRGTFYRGGRAFLHFHEHGDELFADIRLNDDFERLPATKPAERAALLKLVGKAIGDGKSGSARSTSPKRQRR
ncbi:MAG: hypothetical protein ABSA49_17050 [Rhizomicrobium sp.]